MLIAHLADTHLGKNLYGLSWFSEELMQHFREAMEEVMRERVDAVLFAGDMFDVWRPPNRVVREVIDVVHRLVDRGIRVYATLGEHDTPKRRDIPVHLLIPGLRLLGLSDDSLRDCFTVDGREYCVAGVRNHRLTYGEKVRKKLLERVGKAVKGLDKRASVLMMHQNISNFFAFEPGIDISDIPPEPAYVAMGHIHRRIVHRRSGSEQVIAYPGSLDILDKSEIATYKEEGKGFYIVDLSAGVPEVHQVNTPVINMDEVSADLESLEARVEARASDLARSADRAILVVEVSIGVDDKPRADEVIRRLRRRFRERGVYIKVDYRLVDAVIGPSGVEEIDARTMEAQALKALIKERLGTEPGEDLLKAIIMVKDTALAGGEEGLRELLEEVASHKLWDRIVPDVFRLPPQHPKRGGGRDLTAFLRRGS